MQNNRNRGFTLAELLVAAFAGSLVVASLLAIGARIVRSNRQEEVVSTTDRDMQRALDFIANDLREAVFVYDGSCNSVASLSNVCPSYRTALPAFVAPSLQSLAATNGTIARPILAFWKIEPIDDSYGATGVSNYLDESALDALNCAGFPTTPVNQQADCDRIRLTRSQPVFIVYTQTPMSGVWSGESRIQRFRVPKYQEISAGTITRTPGFTDPFEFADPQGIFLTWPHDSLGNFLPTTNPLATASALAGAFPNNNQNTFPVLTDFVDQVNATQQIPNCPAGTDLNADGDTADPGESYLQSPRNQSNVLVSNSFFSCVRSMGGNTQDVLVFLRGNPRGRGVADFDEGLTNEDINPLSIFQSQVLIKGIVNVQNNN
jgi:type II secretory pathway component PulJ